jgi:hypothetical protein
MLLRRGLAILAATVGLVAITACVSKHEMSDGPQVRELRDDELQEVSGGLIYTFSTVYVDSIVVTKPTDVASTKLHGPSSGSVGF